jgi:diguanylate cyclase (GGDEF)-like protein
MEEYFSLLKECVAKATIGDIKDDAPAPAVFSACRIDDRGAKKVFLVEDDVFLLRNLETQIGHFGYIVKSFTTLADFKEAASQEQAPDVIVMDIVFGEGDSAGIDAAMEVQKYYNIMVPLVFISNRTDLPVRLKAVRAGGEAYIVKPVNIGTLMDRLDTLTTCKESEPYRILIVDDEVELSQYHAAILENAAMEANIVNNPMQVFAALVDFTPDLILMDKYMPECNGDELAKAIRQMDAYFSIPIVFLSTETDIDKQMTAMRMGGDDFISKPVDPKHLISSVSIRAERMRIIRSFMERDSLTGLLNHTRTKESLDVALERARRQKGTVSFAMIDIDKFKSVNDTYGHPIGDRVILSLSRLLQQRLRKTDIVGRYGGEEFAVVLSDIDAEGAKKVLDDIRIVFSQIKHQAEGREFFCTFSTGVADLLAHDDAAGISNAADKALYEAKNNGRNMVVKAGDIEPKNLNA